MDIPNANPSTSGSTSSARKASRAREWARNLGVAAASVLGTLALLEAGVRLFAPVPLVASDLFLATSGDAGGPRTPELQQRSARRWLQPNVHCRHTTDEFDVAVRINSKGLRDAERPYAKPPGARRLLMIGDSFTFGYGVEESQRFASLLQNSLRAHDPRAEVIDAGVPSWSTADELLFLREEGWKYHPDAVVDCFYENDVNENVERGLFSLRGGKLVASERVATDHRPSGQAVTRDPINNRILSVGSDQAAPGAAARAPEPGFWISHFQLARLIRLSAFRARSRPSDPMPARRESAQQLCTRLFEEMRREAKARGARFVLVLIPSRQAVASGRPSTLSRFPVIEKWAASQPTGSVIDLLPALRGAGPSPAPYFAHDAHLNTRGHAIAGAALSNALQP